MPSANRHYRLTLADALSAHERALSLGGRAGIASIDLVQSALERPYSGYYRTIARKAAALTQSMALNHGFVDGNKRTTLILLHTLLSKSGYWLYPIAGDGPIDSTAEEMVLAVVRHEIEFEALVDWFEARVWRPR